MGKKETEESIWSDMAGILRSVFITRAQVLWLIGLVALALGVFLFFHFGMAGRLGGAVRGKQSEGLVTDIQKAMRNKEWDKAMSLLSRALASFPDNPAVLRCWDDLLREGNAAPSERLQVLTRLIETGGATTEDRVQVVIATAASGDWKRARMLLNELPGEIRNGSKGLQIEAALLRAEGRRNDAETVLKEAMAIEPDDRQSKRTNAVLDMRKPFTEVQKAARATLLELARGDDDTAIRSMVDLALSANLTTEEATELHRLVKASLRIEDADRYQVLRAVMEALPEEKQRIIAEETQRMAAATIMDKKELFRWLLSAGQPEPVISAIDPKIAEKDAGLFLLLSEAYSLAGEWYQLRRMLTEPMKLPISKAHEALLLAYCEIHSGSISEAEKLARLSMGRGRGEGDLMAVQRVANLADAQNWPELSTECYLWLANNATENKVPLLDKLYRRLEAQGNCALMLVTAKRMADELPDNAEIQRRLAYLRLLSGSEMEMALNFHAQPPLPVDNLIGALGAYRLGNDGAIDSSLRQIRQWNQVSPGQRAVAAGLLKSMGREQEAFMIAEKIQEQKFLPEEKVFLAGLEPTQ